jgi:RND family efflux transporter MFP subunit
MSQRGAFYLKLVVALLVVATVVWLTYPKLFEDQTTGQVVRPGNGAVAVHVAPVHSGPVRELRTFSGTLIPRAQFIVAPKISGRLERVFVDLGDPVQRGQIVALLGDAEFVQQVEQARAELDVARANLAEARSDLDIAEKDFLRIELLRAQGITTQAELDLARSKYLAQQARLKVAKAQVNQRLAALRAAEVRLGYTQVRATWPENGHELPRVVGERFADEGATISANAQVLSVLDIAGLRAVIHVTERDYPRLYVGQAANVTLDALPGRVFEGLVSRIAPIFREASRQARIELELDNPEGLMKPGMFIKATLELDRAEKAVLVPTAAIVRRSGEQAVFLVGEDQRARFMHVRSGIVEGDLTQILEPTDLSGNVVILGQHLLEDGALVHVIQD